MIAAALIAIAVAIGLVRIGWDGRRPLAIAGWTLATTALLGLAWREGAWGIAVGTVAGIATALMLVLHAGWTSPARVTRPAREAPAITLPRRWSDLGRRCAVFVLVVPVAFAATQWLAYGAQAIARRSGAGDADAIVLTLFLQPILWGIVMSWQMTRAGLAQMVLPPAGAALIGTVLWSAS
ncbi:hypothetical protein NF700_08125 [Sphingomonadaceae bacterium OTU29MARTA1]|nr:hypothetical protein NF700_08125 [Sphingomonadaceae bacterium OTU29MARTA1]